MKLDENFQVGDGQMFLPNDPKASLAETANCRCTVRYVRQNAAVWTTLDFIFYYYTGNGKPVDLENIGLLARFRNSSSVRLAVAKYKDKQITLAKEVAEKLWRIHKNTEVLRKQEGFLDQDRGHTDVTNDGPLFAVGRSSLFQSARSVVHVNLALKAFQVRGIMKFSIDDAFVDVADLDSSQPGNQELGGDAYGITASWSESYNERGFF